MEGREGGGKGRRGRAWEVKQVKHERQNDYAAAGRRGSLLLPFPSLTTPLLPLSAPLPYSPRGSMAHTQRTRAPTALVSLFLPLFSPSSPFYTSLLFSFPAIPSPTLHLSSCPPSPAILSLSTSLVLLSPPSLHRLTPPFLILFTVHPFLPLTLHPSFSPPFLPAL